MDEVASWLSNGELHIQTLLPSRPEKRLTHLPQGDFGSDGVSGLALSDEALVLKRDTSVELLGRDSYTTRWSRAGEWWNGLTICQGHVIFDCPSPDYLGECRALSVETGELLWRAPGKLAGVQRDHIFLREPLRLTKWHQPSMEQVWSLAVESRSTTSTSPSGRYVLVERPGLTLHDRESARTITVPEAPAESGWAGLHFAQQFCWLTCERWFAVRWENILAIYDIANDAWSPVQLYPGTNTLEIIALTVDHLVVKYGDAFRITSRNSGAGFDVHAAWVCATPDGCLWRQAESGRWSVVEPTTSNDDSKTGLS